MTIYTIEYYEKDKNFGWTNTMHDKVFAKSEKEALAKFDRKHPGKSPRTITNYVIADY